MSFKLKFKFKIHNRTTNHLKNLTILDDEGVLHYTPLELIDNEEDLALEDVYMHLYKPENIYLNFIDKNNTEQKLLLFQNIKKDLKLTYDIFINRDMNKNYTIQIA